MLWQRCSIDGDDVGIQESIEGLCDDDDGDDVVLELRESLERSYDGDNGDELGAGVETNIYVIEAGFV